MKIDASKLRALAKSHGLTNTKLAEQAGITRQSLQTMLRKSHVVEVRGRTVKGLAQALQLRDESLLSPDPLMGYKAAVADEHAHLGFQGLGLPTTEPRSMEEVYVPIRLTRTLKRESDQDCRPHLDSIESIPIEESNELSFAESLSLPPYRILIRGEPGSGKTTMLRHAARAYARGLLAKEGYPKQQRVPLVVRLAEFAKARERDGDMSLVRFVVTQTLRDTSPDYRDQVEHQIELELQRGACLVLLDGLDEVGSDRRLATLLRRFINDFGGNQFVLTSRVVGLEAGPWRKLGFATFQVTRWREDDIREFARRWYAARPAANRQKKQNDPRAEDLTAAILDHRPLRAIASNPLMLTILAALHHANAALPRRRVELYAKIVEVMLETWEASKRGARPGDLLHGIALEAREFAWLLERLALEMQREGRVLRPRWWMNESIQQFLREQIGLQGDFVKEQTERVIRYLCERTGLLVERGDGVFGFSHRTFQEYFAARGLLLEVEGGGDIVALLRPFLFHPQWEEVVVHVAASLSAPRATALQHAILDDSDPIGRFLRRGQLLALRCLADGAAVADKNLLGQVFSDGEAIGGSRWLGISMRFIDLLKQLTATRREAEAQGMLAEIDQGARNKLSPPEYMTVCWSTQDFPDGSSDSAPGSVQQKLVGGQSIEIMSVGWEKRIKDPEGWCREVLKLVRDRKIEVGCRITFIALLTDEADSNDKAQQTLTELLLRDKRPEIRAGCAQALRKAVLTSPTIAKLILDRLDKDKSAVVRAACAEALQALAGSQTEVRERLEELFISGPKLIRAAAARGLAKVNFTLASNNTLLQRFLATIATSAESTEVRCASIWAISSLLGSDDMVTVDRAIEERLDDKDPRVRATALHVLADAIATGRREWSEPLVDRIATMLMAIDTPCPHVYGDLTVIVGMKEILGGRRLERVLGDALVDFGDLIKFVFVFGSVARGEQVRDSDVDLMVVGDVRLKDLASALHKAEQTLGRTVNPMVFSLEKFRDQYREGSPFLLDIVRKEKIFLKGSRDELTELVAERPVDQSPSDGRRGAKLARRR